MHCPTTSAPNPSQVRPRAARRLGTLLLVLICLLAITGGVSPRAAVGQAGVAAPAAAAAQPQLVRDINTTPTFEDGLAIDNLTVVGGTLFFTDDGPLGEELWRSDGTASGTTLVKDIAPGSDSSSPHSLAAFQGRLLFTADDGDNGAALWQSDGTPGGTTMLRSFGPPNGDAYISSLTPAGPLLFFLVYGGSEAGLWRTDGSAAGTALVKLGQVDSLTALGSLLFFVASETGAGYELWRSDGTIAGTSMARDINPGAASGLRQYSNTMAALDGWLYFVADDGSTGQELWRSNGSNLGTQRVADLMPGPASAAIEDLTVSGGALYFESSNALWRTTGDYPSFVVAPTSLGGISDLTDVGGQLFFVVYDGSYNLWRSDGSGPGSFPITNYDAGFVSFVQGAGDTLFFYHGDYVQQTYGLWATDVTSYLTSEIRAGISFADGKAYILPVAFGNQLAFVASEPDTGYNLWLSDGTMGGTRLLKRGPNSASANPQALTRVNNVLYFIADDGVNGPSLWRSEGSAATTVAVSEQASGATSQLQLNGSELVAIGSTLYFSAFDEATGVELWRSDGTPEGTRLVADSMPGSASTYPRALTAMNNVLYYAGYEPATGLELWRSDGTPEGTYRLTDINPGNGDGVEAWGEAEMAVVDGVLYFAGRDALGVELWRSNGTVQGTWRVRDLIAGSEGSYPVDLTPFRGRLVFQAYTDGLGNELWQSDGTEAGTVVVKDVAPGWRSSYPQAFIVSDNLLYFVADDGVNGYEIWRSDGSEAGTALIKNIDPQNSSMQGFDTVLVAVNGSLFFSANDGVHGSELWTTDGTAEGTVMVYDLLPGPAGSKPRSFASINGNLVFSAYDPATGFELWQSNGTEAGTQLIANIAPGDAHSSPGVAVSAGGDVYFTADDTLQGRELWSLPLALFAEPSGKLTVSSSQFIPGQSLLVLAYIQSGGRPLSGLKAVRVEVGGRYVALVDNGTGADARENDGLYSGQVVMASDQPAEAALYLGPDAGRSATLMLTPIASPKLLAVTDWRALFNEFRDTGMQDAEDENGNSLHDFFDLVERLRSYAVGQGGVILDLPAAITAGEFTATYRNSDYLAGTESRYKLGLLVDQLVAKTYQASGGSLKSVAIVGGDQVVPFYRLADPTDQLRRFDVSQPNYQSRERAYPLNNNALNNATIQDMGEGYFLTDVPYSVSAYNVITPGSWQQPQPAPEVARPDANLGFGRIFALRPGQLVRAVDRYSSPLLVTTGSASASLFTGSELVTSSTLNDPRALDLRVVRNVESRLLAPHFADRLTTRYGSYTAWTPPDFVRQFTSSDLISIWSHASHQSINTPNGGFVRAADLASLSVPRATMLFGFGCNLGLSVSDTPDGTGLADPYRAALMNPLVSQGVTVFAPTSHAYISSSFKEPNIHERMIVLFIDRLLSGNERNVGEIWRSIVPEYLAYDPLFVNNNNPASRLFYYTGFYGYALYGLPTQPIERALVSVRPQIALSSTAQSLPAAAPEVLPSTITIETPDLILARQDDGTTLVQLPNASTLIAPSGLPAVPAVTRSFVLPHHISVTGLQLVDTQSRVLPGRLSLATQPLATTNGDLITTQYEVPERYPENVFTYTVTPQDGGSILTLVVSPVQYDSRAQQLTIHERLTFAIQTVQSFPAAGATLTSVEVNQGQPVRVGGVGQSMLVTLAGAPGANGSAPATLRWALRTADGMTPLGGSAPLAIGAGSARVTVPLNSESWQPGVSDLIVELLQDDVVTSSKNIPVLVEGLSMQEPNPQPMIYDAQLGAVRWSLAVSDEQGRLVAGLAGQFEAMVDGQPASLKVVELERGLYEVELALAGLQPGSHRLTIAATDARGFTARSQWTMTKLGGRSVFIPLIAR